MEITEPVESINIQLKDLYGQDTLSGLPIWRVSWSETQTEKQLIDTTEFGVKLLYPEVREVKKYLGFIKDKYILERLVLVEGINAKMLPTQKTSYEPVWIFETQSGIYLPPKMEVCQIVINHVYNAQGKKNNLDKYTDPTTLEETKKRLDNIVEELAD